MPVRKKQKRPRVTEEELQEEAAAQDEHKIMIRLVDEQGTPTGTQLLLPAGATPKQLDALLTSMIAAEAEASGNTEDAAALEERLSVPYAFFIDGEQINDSVRDVLMRGQRDAFVARMLKEGRRVRPGDVERLEFEPPEETVVEVVYKPQAVFRVRPVTRCAGTLDGHSEAVLVVSFSPDSQALATGGGDKTIRIWDMSTLTPYEELTQHASWVQALAWSPDGAHLASGSKDGVLVCWRHDGGYGKFAGKRYKAHGSYLSHIAWEPMHANARCDRFVSASKDATLKVWSATGGLLHSLAAHQAGVTCVRWGGAGLIYSSSQDRTILVWEAETGAPRHALRGHAHWVNFLALSTDLVLRTGAFDHEARDFGADRDAAAAHARARYDAVIARSGGGERLVSASDDNTMFLWDPAAGAGPLARLTGHQGAVFHIQFSPDGTLLASCSADKSVKLWSAADGKFIATLRGHVAAVYHVSWSLDSRMLVSGSKDTTLKLWSVARRELVEDMAGHSDEIFATDWSPDGQKVATGSKDKRVRIWVH